MANNWENMCHKYCKSLIPRLLTWTLDTVPSPGLCPYCSIHLLHSSTVDSLRNFPPLFKSLGKCHLLSEGFSDHPVTPSSTSLIYFSPWHSSPSHILFHLLILFFVYISSLGQKLLVDRNWSVLFTAMYIPSA